MKKAPPTAEYLQELEDFSQKFSQKRGVVEWREEEFQLRGGTTSHWLVDTRYGLSHGSMLGWASRLLLGRAIQLGLNYQIVAGNGVGGRMFPGPMALVALEDRKENLGIVLINDDEKDHHPTLGYGVHGAPVEGEEVLPVDDISTSGNSQLTSTNMLREAGATVKAALCLTDRSRGQAALALRAVGVELYWLLDFDDSDGTLSPASLGYLE